MAVARSELQPVQASAPIERTAAILRMFGALCLISSIRRMGIRSASPLLDLWIQLADDNEDNELRIYRALSEMDAKQLGPLVEEHVIFASESDDAFPRDALVIYERP